MVNFNWKGKNFDLEHFLHDNIKQSDLILQEEIYYPSFLRDKENKILSLPDQNSPNPYPNENNIQNLLISGENEKILRWLLRDYSEKISLIYIDPPFFTGGDFNLKLFIGDKKKNYIETLSYNDTWKDGLDSYLNFLYKRIFLMKKLISPKGSFYIHLDWHNSHYVKLMLDELFGSENFRNEIIWAYPAASARTKNFFVRSYDTILFYSKSEEYVFNDDPNIYQEYSERVKSALKEDEKGLFYYRGGSHDGKKLSRKVYVDKPGVFPRDVWNDIPYIRANTKEYQGFSTQKPERLLKRIILASSNEGDIIADFFSGSGTTLAVAEKLSRRWIGSDINPYSIHRTKKRLLDLKNSHNLYNWKKKYRKSANPFKILYFDGSMANFKIPSDLIKNKGNNSITKDYNSKIYYSIHKNNQRICIELIDYVILIKNEFSEKIKGMINSNLDLIDFWGIDFNFKNQIFSPNWISFRNPHNRKINLLSKPFGYKEGNYEVLIKVIDCFGKEIIVKEEIQV